MSLAGAVAGPCPLCDGPMRRCFVRNGHVIGECERCGHRAARVGDPSGHVARQYGDEYFTAGGVGYDDYDREREGLAARGAWYGERLARVVRPGTLLDVGAAGGHLATGFARTGWTITGVEPNARMAAAAAARTGRPVHAVPFEEFSTGAPFDAVALVQVIAHFVDVRAVLDRLPGLVRPGGALLVETWDRASVVARVLGRQWHEYSPPSALHYFTRAGLDRELRARGFVAVESGRPPKRIALAHARAVLRASGTLGRLAALPLAGLSGDATVPYPLDDVFWGTWRRAG